jgi:hypothetical protein
VRHHEEHDAQQNAEPDPDWRLQPWMQERKSMGYERQGPLIEYLAKKKQLRPELKPARAREILWARTSRVLYRIGVRERGWPGPEFADWLGGTLVDVLLG